MLFPSEEDTGVFTTGLLPWMHDKLENDVRKLLLDMSDACDNLYVMYCRSSTCGKTYAIDENKASNKYSEKV